MRRSHCRLTVPLIMVMAAMGPSAQGQERAVPAIPPPDQRIRVIIDTDCACEVDDPYALALALRCPERFQIEGFIAAHFGDSGGPEGVDRSYNAIQTVLEKAGLAGRFPVKRGSHPLRYSSVPEPSEGVDFLVERALAADSDGPLWVVALGPCTDLASAYLKEPGIKDRIIAFWHGRTRWPKQAWNFNAYNDVKAVRILFASELPLVLFDAGAELTCSMEESARRILPTGPLGRHLHEIRLASPGFQAPTKGLFDLGDVAFLVDPTLARTEVVPAPGVDWDLSYEHHERHGRIVRAHSIDRDRTFDLLVRKLDDTSP